MADASQKGRMNWKPGETRKVPKGEAHSRAKLAAADVQAIRSSKETGVALAAQYNVAPKTISRLRRNESWRPVH